MAQNQHNTPINILLADDDADERYIFGEAVKALPIAISFKTVVDGTTLMDYLNHHLESLPDVLFLDINMPRKNGKECLIEIKSSQTLKHLTVIMYSVTKNEKEIDTLYLHGANSFLKKDNYTSLIKGINQALSLVAC